VTRALPLPAAPAGPCGRNHRPGAILQVDRIDATARILSLYAQATPAELRDGLGWYTRARRDLTRAALAAGCDPLAGPIVAAILSPRSPWSVNLAGALALLADPDAVTRGAILPRSLAVARAYRRGKLTIDAALTGPKVRAFARNLAGDLEAVTVDVWATRAALGRDADLARCGCDHAALGAAYRDAAAVAGITPAAMQAVAWVVVRRQATRG
jgi:hypothetical protein